MRHTTSTDAMAETALVAGDEAPSDRRRFIRRAATAAGGAAAATLVMGDGQAHAAVGTMQFGVENDAGVDGTRLTANTSSGAVWQVVHSGSGGTAILASASGGIGIGVAAGIIGGEFNSGGTGVKATGTFAGVNAVSDVGPGVLAQSGQIAVVATGTLADLMLGGNGPAPASRADGHAMGEMLRDAGGSVWVCVADGTPGQWRKLAGPTTAGALHAIEPTRVYDSRWPGRGPIAAGEDRVVAIGTGRNVATGAAEVTGLVPPDARAVQYTLTVVDTVGAGFLALTSEKATTYRASTVNWASTGVSIANSTMGKVTSPSMKVWCGGAGSTQFVIDVLGYYL
jgi:hypothetical protein